MLCEHIMSCEHLSWNQFCVLYAGLKEFVACNHLRSHHFFTESINSACPFEGYRCDSEDHFNVSVARDALNERVDHLRLNGEVAWPSG